MKTSSGGQTSIYQLRMPHNLPIYILYLHHYHKENILELFVLVATSYPYMNLFQTNKKNLGSLTNYVYRVGEWVCKMSTNVYQGHLVGSVQGVFICRRANERPSDNKKI